MSPFSMLLLTALAAGDVHESQNTVYRELRTTGLSVGATALVQLPAATLADGLDAKAQEAIIKSLCGQETDYQEFMRKSVNSPFIRKYVDLMPSDPMAPARRLDYWFVAYGDLDKLVQPGKLQPFINANRKDTKVHDLTAEELKTRGIELPKSATQERYYHAVFPLMERIQLSVTNRTTLTRTPESVVLAGCYQPGFAKDKEFPNLWRHLKDDLGQLIPEAATHPYQGFAYYVKVTRLVEPRGALFVEHHVVFTEPHGWFNGQNVMRSKLGRALQAESRAFRRDLEKAD